MNKILKVLSCLACVFAFCFLAIGYAAVQDDLSVNGSVSIEPQEQAYAVYCDTLENGSQVPYWWGGGVLAFYYGYPPKEGDCISYTIEDEPNNLKISHVYTGVEDTTAGVPWLQDKLNPREVFFDESFQTVQPLTTAKWFLKYSNLNNIRQLEYLDTSQVTSMEAMFDTCKSLKTLAFGENFNTSKVTNMKEMFSDAGLTELDLSKFNTENVTDMSYMFAGSNKLKTLDLSNFITSSVTHIGGMFSGCSGLKTLNISNFNTVNVTNMASVFEACSSLTELNLTHFDTSKVFDMYQMFRGCQNLEELNVSSFNTSNVTNMHGMFEGCAALKTLDLSNFNTSKVTDMTQMFAMITVTNSVEEKLISNLITIYVGETFTVGDKTASEEMFKYCERLVGGNGTTYDSNYIGKDYARIDGVDSKKGYFTADPQGQE